MITAMDSLLKSTPFLILVSVLLWVLGCSEPSARDRQTKGGPWATEEISLKNDRSQLDALRTEIPEERRSENDELAAILQFTGEIKDPPSKVQSRFDSALRKSRERFYSNSRKLRRDFDKQERKSRDEFLALKNKERDKFKREKHSGNELQQFFQDQESEKNQFFSDQRDRRREFESDLQERERAQEAYFREKSNEFSQELRIYTKNFYDLENAKKLKEDARKKQQKLQTTQQDQPARPAPSDQTSDLLKDFEKMKTAPAERLQPSEDK